MAKRKINIINSTEYQKLIMELGLKKDVLNTWDVFELKGDTIDIMGIELKVKFLDSTDGCWFKIKRFTNETVYLETFGDFGMMRNC